MKKNSWKKKISILEKVAKLVAVKVHNYMYILVDFEYLFLGESFGLEIWHLCFNIEMVLLK